MSKFRFLAATPLVLVFAAIGYHHAPKMDSAPVVAPAAVTATAPDKIEETIAPFVSNSGNIAAAELGGVIETMTDEYGPGETGNLLINGKADASWHPRHATFPQETVLSFFNRQRALIDSVIVTAPAATSPKDIEIWVSTTSPEEGFERVAVQTLRPTGADQSIGFDPIEANYVKVRVLSGNDPAALELQEIQIVEGSRDNYTPLATLHPDMTVWKRSPRHAAQRGIEWLETAAVRWQEEHNCYGCHVQSQVIMGLAISTEAKYVVNKAAVHKLAEFVQATADANGAISNGQFLVTGTQFAAMGLAAADKATSTKTAFLVKPVDFLLKNQQPTGELPADHSEPPIDQGMLMTTANSVAAFMQAFAETHDARYQQAALRALKWVAAASVDTTQDKVFKLIALAHYGNAQQKQIAQRLVQLLRSEQLADGGWREASSLDGSSPYSTGQVLYAFKQAGVSVESEEFVRGVNFLLSNQKENGAWPSMKTLSSRPSEFAPTMWAVIGLAGSFRDAECAEVERQPNKIIIRMCSRALFDLDRYVLKPEAQQVLTGIKASLIDRYPTASVDIEGYTDDLGTAAHNMTLSLNRARSVVEWMQQQRVAQQVKPVGLGMSKPRFPNDNEENRARNRRVEIVLTLSAANN